MSSSFTLSRRIPLDQRWDVIVVGGGPAGCTAAAAAARDGARTLLIECSGCLGGMGTSGLVPAWCPFSDKHKIIYKGLAEQVFTAAKSGMTHVPPEATDWVPIDPERLKRVYDDLVTSHGAAILFNTALAAVERDDHGNVTAIILNNKAGLSACRARVYVDCTGDADLAAWAGAEFHKGDDDPAADGGPLQPATHCFALANVDEHAYRNGPELHPKNPQSPIYRILSSGRHTLIPDLHLCSNVTGPGTVGFNAGHVFNVDSTDPASVSAALIHGRRLAAAYRDALAEFHPDAFADSYLVMTAPALGIRESRRVVGDYVLTLADYLARASFDDEICRNSYFLDVHKKIERAAQSYATSAKLAKATLGYAPGESHGIPYRCLTPRGLRNVLVAGRSISCDRLVQGSVRVMPVCLAMGEAAGAAAAQATLAEQVDVHGVDTARLRARLRENGAYLPPTPAESPAPRRSVEVTVTASSAARQPA